MRIVIAGINHETNTYCLEQTVASDFHQSRGERILRSLGTETSIGGALETCAELGIEALPLLVAQAQPSGIIEQATYEEFKDEILSGIKNQLPIDGVFLDLHGAGVADGIQDLEGDLVLAIRNLVGPNTPIAATFDLHGNISAAMCENLDGTFACHQYPHIDLHLRAREAIELIIQMTSAGIRPVSHVERLPMLMPTTTTFTGIGEARLALMLAAEEEAGVIDVSWFHGFPYADTEHVGVYIVVTTTGDRAQAARVARGLAADLWAVREGLRAQSLSAKEALAAAQSSEARPVVINETSDNCGAGAPGDGTHLLKVMLDAHLERACFGFIVDPAVAEQASEAGVGATIQIELGGKYDDFHGQPLKLSAYVKSLHDGKLRMRAMFKGMPLHIGKMARLVVNGVDVIVASRRSQTFDIAPFQALGIEVSEYDIVALKSSNHFRAGFAGIAGAIVTADTPGFSTHKIEIFPRQSATGPLWPMDPAAHYPE